MKTIYKYLAPVWDYCLSFTGFKRGLEAYVRRIPLKNARNPHMLDIGCGTGITCFALLERYPHGTMIATDLDAEMVAETRRIAEEKGLREDRFMVFRGDVNSPDRLEGRHGDIELPDGSFDAIVASGVLEYADLDATIPKIVRLLKPGGTFISISMNGGPIAKVFKHVFAFEPVDHGKLADILERSGCAVSLVPFTRKEFSANLTRFGVVAVKGGA